MSFYHVLIFYHFLISLIFCIAIQISSFAAPDIPQSAIPRTINTHDLQNIKYKEIEQQVQEDYQNYEKRKKEGKIKPEKSKAQKDKKGRTYYTTESYGGDTQLLTSERILEVDDNNIVIRGQWSGNDLPFTFIGIAKHWLNPAYELKK